ncbi:MAG TPA: glycosyltransferase [Pyrinomonadaceae bacterium]|jgi:glycosyltransferase involved in cell wall biosynthesis
MQDNPFFSVVIPTYNRAHLIRKTIESVLAQEDTDFEIIVVDDGSRDNTEEVVRAIADKRVTYYKKENAERAAARNYGAQRASGRYINFFDSDDLLYPNHLRVARRLIEEKNEPEIFHLGFEMQDVEGRLLYRVDSFKGSLNEQLPRGNLLSCNGVFLRRDVALRFPFNEDRKLSASEDWELWLRLASRYEIHYSNEVTSIIVNHDERSVLGSQEAALLNRKDLTLKYLFEDEAFVEKYGRRKRIIENEFLSYIALHLALSGAPRRACKYLKDSVIVLPSSVFRRRFLAVVKHVILNSRKSII